MKITRRQAIGSGLAAMAVAAAGRSEAAVAPKKPSVGAGEIGPRLKLGCAAYSYRDLLPHDGKPGKMTLLDWLELAAAWDLDGVELTSYYFTSDDAEALNTIKAKAYKLGLDISGTSVGNNFCFPAGDERTKQIEHTKQWVDHAVTLGAPCVRVFAGHKRNDADRKSDFNSVVECIKPCCEYAGKNGVFLALENHGYLTETAPDVLDIVEAVGNEWLGVNLDTGNFVSDPYKNMELVAPKAITTHTKTELRTKDGSGSEPADFARIMSILRAANYRGYISLEYEGKEDATKAVPDTLAKLREAITAAARPA